jgi:PAS domain S-box-containing protein
VGRDTDLAKGAGSELAALTLRLESLRSLLAAGAGTTEIDAEIAAALDQVRDARKRIEEERGTSRATELQDAYARLETVLQQLPEGVMIVDGDGELLLANRRAEELLGRSSNEIAGSLRERSWTLGAAGVGVEEPATDVLGRVATGDHTLDGRFRYRKPDGDEVIVEATATPVHAEVGVPSVVMTFQDVTARERRERAERDFVTNAAHELQTPIAAIAGAVEVLQAGAKHDAVDRDHFLAHVEAACRRLERLTRALLVLARAQTRDEAPRRELIAVGPLLESVAESIAGQSEVEVQCAQDLAVIANRPLLEQALENLAQNALKHTRGLVVLAGGREDGIVVIRVRDSGSGIPAAERERVFERFYRADDLRTDGFGLGLAIVSEAVAALDGELEVDTSSTGTAVSIKLPAAKLIQP